MKITSIVLHYNRQQNIREVVSGIKDQTVQSDILVWDNSNNCPNIEGVTAIHSQRNFNCQPRFWLAAMCDTEYIWTQDDDFKIIKKDLFERMIALSKENPDCMLGVKGKVFGEWSNKEKPYQHNSGWLDAGKCDMVNTGLCFFPTKLLNKIPMHPYSAGTSAVTKHEYRYGDDIWVSTFQDCLAYDYLKEDIGKLPEGEERHILSKQTAHMDVRNDLCRRYFL